MAFDASLWGQQATHTINIGQVPSSQSNVPLLITKNLASFPSSMLDGGSTSALNGGGDIRVSTDTAGANQLPVEIVSCVTSATPANQELIMWVRVPTVNDSEVIYITWNRAGQSQPPVTDTFGRNAVWQDYIGVFHLQDSSWTDSSGNSDLTVDGSTPPSIVSTAEGNAARFIAANNTFLARSIFPPIVAKPVTLQIKGITTDITSTLNDSAVSISGSGGGTDFSAGFSAGDTNRRLNTVALNTAYSSSILSGGGILGDVVYNTSIWDAADAISSRGYFDGNLLTGSGSNAGLINFVKLGIGGRIDGSPQYFTMDVLEARFLLGVMTSDRIDAEYNNQSNQAAWATIGTPYVPGGSAINVNPLTVNYNIAALAVDVNTPYDILAATANYNINALAATVSFAGAIDVTALPANYDVAALIATVAVSGDIDVISQPANISYAAISATVSLFGTIDVNPAVVNYNIESYQAYVQNETISVECICGYEGVITTSINFDGIITGDIGLNGLIDDSDINRVGAIDNSDLAFKGGLCHCE